MSAATIAAALGGNYKSGAWWRCRCPVHSSTGATLAVRDAAAGGIEVKCFAGCQSKAVVEALRRRGLLTGKAAKPDPEAIERQREADIRNRARRTEGAREIWRETIAANYILETYLGGRLILAPIPATIRLHRSLRNREAGCRRPAMGALGEHAVAPGLVAIHCTYLASNGEGKASIDPVKRCIGPVGGGAVRLAPAAPTLAVTEGIESGLSYMEATGIPTWAALSAVGIRSLILPDVVTEVVIAADPDPIGIMAARAAAKRWLAEGRRVGIARPPIGLDFNDMARVMLG